MNDNLDRIPKGMLVKQWRYYAVFTWRLSENPAKLRQYRRWQPRLETGIFRTQVWSVITASNHLTISSFRAVLNSSESTYLSLTFMCKGVDSWLRHCVTSWKVAGLIPEGFIGTFYSLGISAPPMTLWSNQTNRSEYRLCFLGVKAADA